MQLSLFYIFVSCFIVKLISGSTTALTNTAGAIIESATYDSFGNATGNLSTRYGYTGREFDADLGLQYSRARWYDATIGRFISEDPIGFAGKDINLYGYVWNSPIKLVDPMGTDGGATLVGGGTLILGALESLGATAAAVTPPALIVGGGAVLIYGSYQIGEGIARYRYPEQFPGTQTTPIPPFPTTGESCDAKPKPTSMTMDYPKTNDGSKGRCNPKGTIVTGGIKKFCSYQCAGGTLVLDNAIQYPGGLWACPTI